MSQIYLESLKTYEHYASSDELFSRAVQLFPLRGGARPTPIERLKREVLRVSVPRNTKIMEIAATCRDPKLAHDVARYLARETMQLNRTTSQAGKDELLADANRARDDAAAGLRAAEAAYTGVATRMPTPAALGVELARLTSTQDGLSRVALSLAYASGDSDSRSDRLEQRVTEQAAELDARAAAKQAQLAARSAEIEAASARLRKMRAQPSSKRASASASLKRSPACRGNGSAFSTRESSPNGARRRTSRSTSWSESLPAGSSRCSTSRWTTVSGNSTGRPRGRRHGSSSRA